MIKKFKQMPFRIQILSVLLLNTILLSGFSLIFVHSLEEIDSVSKKVKETDVPEMLWISQWQREFTIRQFLVESFVNSNEDNFFITQYEAQELKTIQTIQNQEVQVPESLEEFERDISRLDFMVLNNVQGLMLNNEEEAAKLYLKQHYLPRLGLMKQELEEIRQETFDSLSGRADMFSVIIEKSLYLLLLLTAVSVFFSIVTAYRISSRLAEPIEQMIGDVNEIASGHYGLHVQQTDQFELNNLTASINKMSQRLQESFQTITDDKVYREQILNSLPIGIITVNDETKQYTMNTFADRMLKMEQGAAKYLAEKEMAGNGRFWNLLQTGSICQNEKVPVSLNNRLYQLLVSQTALFNPYGSAIGRIFYFVDITKIEKLEQQIHQSEKLALVGEMAAGAAHEIRNPLAVIYGFLSLMDTSLPEKEKEQFFLPLMIKELQRINIIIEDMLLLSKPESPILKEVYMKNLIEDILPLIKPNAKHIDFCIDLEPCPVWIDENQMKQVWHNLIRNSAEAMEKKGTISIWSSAETGAYKIYIQDTGKGISPAHQSQLFDPFFTSKESGTGLGLTVVQRIIENHGGTIELQESSGQGTVFCITLPLLKLQ